jgi:hypothetical protein
MGFSASAFVEFIAGAVEAGSAAEGAGAAASTVAASSTAAEAGTAAAAASTAGTTTATLGASGATATGAATGTGLTLGNAAAAASLASTAYALTKGVPKVPTPGQITPADNGAAISQAADVEARNRERALAGGASSTMLTGGRGSGLGATTSSALLGS